MAEVEYGPFGIVGMTGRAGNGVFFRRADGSFGVRRYVTPANPHTPAQEAVRRRFGQATRAFHELKADDLALWEAYAQKHARHDAATGKTVTPRPLSLFVALTTRFLQVNPTGTILVTPPTQPFAGDTITLTAAAGTGDITFTASAANAANVTTELLLQKLPTPNRQPRPDGYRSAGSMTFTKDDLTAIVPAVAGFYAAAFRFVSEQTGQDTLPTPIPVTGTVTQALRKAA